MPPLDLLAGESTKTLADYTCPMLLVPELHGRDAAAVVHELSYLLYRAGYVPDVLPFYRAALDRERASSSATNHSWAWPRAVAQGLKQPCFALGRCAAPLVWPPGWQPSVQLVFLLATPENSARHDQALMAGVLRLHMEPPLRTRLSAARDRGELFDVLSQVSLPVLVDAA